MTSRLDDKIRAFVLELVDDPPAAPEIDFEPAKLTSPSQLRQMPKQRRAAVPVVAIIGAALLILIAIGLPVLLFSGGSEVVEEPTTPTTTAVPQTTTPVTTTPPTTTAADLTTTTTSTAPVAAPVPNIEWVEVDLDPEIANMEWIVPTEYGLLAAGSLFHPSGEGGVGALWNSTDGGRTWVEVEPGQFDVPEHFGWARVGPIGVSPDGTVVVVVSDVDDFLMWTTTDLQSWRRIESPDFAGADMQNIHGITWGSAGFVAVGRDAARAGVWVSPDGIEWERIDDEDLIPTEWDGSDMWDVTAGGPGYIAVGLVGFRWPATGDRAGAIWTSDNGYEWDLQIVDDPGDHGLVSVEVDPVTGRLIAFGGDTWYSNDGYQWEWVDRKVPLGGPPPGSRVAWQGNIAVAGFMDAAFSLWVSGDAGDTWTRVDPEQPMFDWCGSVADIVEVDGQFVAVGYRAHADGCQADPVRALWIGTLTPQE